jgi:hypothetical protein
MHMEWLEVRDILSNVSPQQFFFTALRLRAIVRNNLPLPCSYMHKVV